MKFKIPKHIVLFILFQRTAYQLLWRNFFVCNALKLIGFNYNRVVQLEARIFTKRIKNKFQEDIDREYEDIKSYLPKQVNSFLDIGCGVGGIDILLYNHYRRTSPFVHLVDKTAVDEDVYYNYNQKGSFYNSLPNTRLFLLDNNVPDHCIHLKEVDETGTVTFLPKSDLVISLISWGFHYPVSTYLETVYSALKPNGVLIIDIRKGSGGEKEVRKRFGNIKRISENKKKIRVTAIKYG